MRQDDLRVNSSMRYLGDSKKRRKKTFPWLANARAKRWKESSPSGSGDTGDVSGAANDDKENHPMDQRNALGGDHFRKEKNKAVKKANYWEDQAGKRSADVEELKSSLGMKETELRGEHKTIRRQNEVIERQEEIISGLNATNKRHQVEIHALKEKIRRIPARLRTVMKRAAAYFGKQKEETQTYHLKHDGSIPDKARDIFAEMVALDNVPANKVVRVFKRIGEVFGVNVKGDVSRRSIGRITKEGGVAAKLQFAEASQKAKVITEANEKLQFFLGIKTAVNHTSETQRDGWIELVEEIFALLFESGMCSEAEAREFWNLVTGMNSDHAADQKKLFELLKEWKKKLEREMRGEKVVKGMDQLRLVGQSAYHTCAKYAVLTRRKIMFFGLDPFMIASSPTIANPELLIAPSVSHETASLDGTISEAPYSQIVGVIQG
ncbi:hypothetical protein R3P38DRAFT_2786865 [Favolaschia claudopus]|uniref:Uncharacterized protein n=1 Tax=Favolaschia claudopus TaxID=2862362 RepID=A0AAW0ARD2_9AGAR